MENIIKEITEKLLTHQNKMVDEFNEVFDALEERNTSLDEQSFILERQNLALIKQDKDKKIFMENEESLKKKIVALQLANQNLEHQAKVMKKEAKATKEQIKRNKASMKAKDAKISKLEKVKPANDQKLQPLTTVYTRGDEVLLIWPSQLEMGVNGNRSKQTVLLFTDRQGCYVTCFLDENNEVGFTTPIRNDAEISDRTRNLIQKNILNISDECADFAQQWLYRLNVIQKGVLKPIDLTCFN